MDDVVIAAENLGKKYVIGHQGKTERYVTLRDVLARNTRSFWRKTKDLLQGKPIIQGDELEEVWALQRVSFEIRRGEVVGIIGYNGAGKSTLLKVLSRITEPSAGRVTIKGRVGSLLEVGTGFHSELTGRENIYLNGAVLGMTRAEVKRKFDEIVAFAEVEKFLDTPVKRYSSGMYVRLGFAVAAHLEPEILIVDEVLAVGDAAFQKKCLGKMGQVASEGRTVLFVSHNMGSVRQLCGRAILLTSGRVQTEGSVAEVVAAYLNSKDNASDGQYVWNETDMPGDDGARLKAIRLRAQNGDVRSEFGTDEPIGVEAEYSLLKRTHHFRISLALWTVEGTCVLVSLDSESPERCADRRRPGRYISRCQIPAGLLNVGFYMIRVYGVLDNGRKVFADLPELRFEVVRAGGTASLFPEKRHGVVAPQLAWQVCYAERECVSTAPV